MEHTGYVNQTQLHRSSRRAAHLDAVCRRSGVMKGCLGNGAQSSGTDHLATLSAGWCWANPPWSALAACIPSTCEHAAVDQCARGADVVREQAAAG